MASVCADCWQTIASGSISRQEFTKYAHELEPGLHVVDVSRPERPERVTYFPDGPPRDIVVQGDIAFVIGATWLTVFDVSLADAPSLLAIFHPRGETPPIMRALFVWDDEVLIASDLGLDVFSLRCAP